MFRRRTGQAIKWVAVAALGLLLGCVGALRDSGEPLEERKLPEPTGTCIFVRTIQDFQVESPYVVLVRTRATGWQYRVELDRRCTQLPFAQAVGWTSNQGRVCDYRYDAVLVRGDRCAIGRITKIEPRPTPSAAAGEADAKPPASDS